MARRPAERRAERARAKVLAIAERQSKRAGAGSGREGNGNGNRNGNGGGARRGAGSRRGTGGPGGTATCLAAPPRPAPPRLPPLSAPLAGQRQRGGSAETGRLCTATHTSEPLAAPVAGGRGRVKVRPPEVGSSDRSSSTQCSPRWVAGSGPCSRRSPALPQCSVPATPAGPHWWARERAVFSTADPRGTGAAGAPPGCSGTREAAAR